MPLMTRVPSTRRRAAFAGAALVACLAGACAPLGLYRPGDADAPEVVNVVLHDTSIDLSPVLVARGKVGFEVVNEGLLGHRIHVVGPGVDEEMDELLDPGAHRRLTVKLETGTVSVSCPDGNHADRGMRASLTVTDSVNTFRR